MMKSLVVVLIAIGLGAVICLGVYRYDAQSGQVARLVQAYPWLEMPYRLMTVSGRQVGTFQETLLNWGQSPVLTTTVRLTGETARNVTRDVGHTLFPDAKTKALQNSAHKQLKHVDKMVEQKRQQLEQLQQELHELQTRQKMLSETAYPLKKYAPDLSGWNFMQWFQPENPATVKAPQE